MAINEIDSLIDYIPKFSNPLAQLNEINRKRIEDQQSLKELNRTNFMTHLNADGVKQLHEFGKMFKRRDLFDHFVRMEFTNQFAFRQIGAILVKPEHLKDSSPSEEKSDD